MTNLIPIIRTFTIFFFGFFIGVYFLPAFLQPFSSRKYLIFVAITAGILLGLVGVLVFLGGF